MRNSAVEENQMEDSWPSHQEGNCTNVKPVEQLLTPDCNGSYETDACDEFLKEPDILPRIGDEFQVEIPPLTYEFDYNFLVGLPVPCYSQKHALSRNSLKNENFSNREKFETIYWVPGSRTEEWTDAEKASFLLALYIFQKDFVEVRRFVETKEMGAVLSFYYGEFYGSDVYHRWSDGQKKKSKKCVYGQRIFSGLRQQELLSRVLPRISEHIQDAILEVFKRFSDDKISLEECVSSLKAMVGTSILVEAIGIGTGKRDLTGMALEPLRSNKAVTVLPEIPSGKACSTLTTSEIIKFIGGNFRLSKNRSNDLFWEAVWPRLLARGWHSEQPKDQSFKNGLVFLVPGVKKFSRRKLVRGDHYFDSVSDVLNKVGREPESIELYEEEDDCEKKLEVLTNERESGKDDDDSPSRTRRTYLQPRTTNWDADVISFMVVDTSLRGGKIRELRSLPAEVLSSLTSQNRTKDSREEEMGESETRKRSSEKAKSNEGMKSEKGLHKDKHLKKVPSKKMKRANEDHIAPPMKKKTRETKPGSGFENGMSSCTSSIRELPQNLVLRTGFNQDKMSSASSSKGSPNESVECAFIDLNMPQMPVELENAFIITESSKGQESKISSDIEAKTNKEPIVNPRRHSTRTREPTMRALEAVADGYLAVNRRRKSKDGETIYRPLQCVHDGTRPADSSNSMASHQTEEVENISKSNEFSDFQEANEESVLGQELTMPTHSKLNLFR